MQRSELIWERPEIVRHTQTVLDSFRHWTKRDLIALSGTPLEQSRAVFHAPQIVCSHGTQADPIFNYANQAAMDVWEMDWETFTKTPSRLSAEPLERTERQRLMKNVRENGFVDNYHCVRISSTGRRFEIDVMVWNLLDESGAIAGQAAMYERWKYI